MKTRIKKFPTQVRYSLAVPNIFYLESNFRDAELLHISRKLSYKFPLLNG